MKKIIYLGVIVLSLVLAGSVLAASNGLRNAERAAKKSADTSAAIACVGGAVKTREQALGTAIGAHADALVAAYLERASALDAAYTKTSGAEVKPAVRAAWDAFRRAGKEARAGWQKAQRAAWARFKTESKTCRASKEVADDSNASAEVKGE